MLQFIDHVNTIATSLHITSAHSISPCAFYVEKRKRVIKGKEICYSLILLPCYFVLSTSHLHNPSFIVFMSFRLSLLFFCYRVLHYPVNSPNKKGYCRSNILLRIYLAKFVGTYEAYAPRFQMITMNRCLPGGPSQTKHRGKPLHGG